MDKGPWLTILGLGEDGPEGLPAASADMLAQAEVIMGPPRHLQLLGETAARVIEWPVPFADGLPLLMAEEGRRVVVLASGDPFWFGAGSVIARALPAGAWRAIPGPSCFSLVAARMGWALERTRCLGLHAAALTQLAPHLEPGAQLIVTLRDGAAVTELAGYLAARGFCASRLTVCEALGGPRERLTSTTADTVGADRFVHPVCVAIEVAGDGALVGLVPGRSDALFSSDGQITKAPVRALTLAALAPRRGERLWDIGGGTGSVGLEWLLADPSLRAIAFEPRQNRAARIAENAASMGVDRLQIVIGAAPDALAGQPPPDAVFIGGGLSEELLEYLAGTCAGGTRLVANAVTLESEALLTRWREKLGGELMRIALSHAAPLGTRTGWKAAYPIVQWSVTL